jgi:hypothetical protein
MGMKYGDIIFEMESDDEEISYSENYFPTHFDNNYVAEIPNGLVPILKKIIDHVDDSNLFSNVPDGSDIDYQRFEITIDGEGFKKEISLTHIFSYFGDGDSQGVEYDEIMEEWEKEGVFNMTEIPEDGYLTLKYNGGGDSGYIEDRFESGQTVPSIIEEWCYRELESNFGGWEINEGSQGEFEFDFNEKIVTLGHTYNTMVDESNTLWEEKF